MPGARIHSSMIQTAVVMALAIGSVATGSRLLAGDATRFEYTERRLGVDVNLTLYADQESVANDAAAAAWRRIDALNLVLSDYDENSEAMRLCRTAQPGKPVAVSQDLWNTLRTARRFSELTDGAFDVTAGPLTKLWRRARRKQELPDPEQIAETRRHVGDKFVRFHPETRSIELAREGMQLDFGGIGKGLIAQEAFETLKSHGCRRALVAIAGDIVAGDPPPDAAGWKVGIAPLDKPDGPPSRHLLLKNCAASTSGDAFQFVEINGVRYSHFVDVATGVGLTRRCSVTVVAPDGATADGLATSACLLGPDRGLKLIEATPGAAGLYVVGADGGLVATPSARLNDWLAPEQACGSARAAIVQE